MLESNINVTNVFFKDEIVNLDNNNYYYEIVQKEKKISFYNGNNNVNKYSIEKKNLGVENISSQKKLLTKNIDKANIYNNIIGVFNTGNIGIINLTGDNCKYCGLLETYRLLDRFYDIFYNKGNDVSDEQINKKIEERNNEIRAKKITEGPTSTEIIKLKEKIEEEEFQNIVKKSSETMKYDKSGFLNKSGFSNVGYFTTYDRLAPALQFFNYDANFSLFSNIYAVGYKKYRLMGKRKEKKHYHHYVKIDVSKLKNFKYAFYKDGSDLIKIQLI